MLFRYNRIEWSSWLSGSTFVFTRIVYIIIFSNIVWQKQFETMSNTIFEWQKHTYNISGETKSKYYKYYTLIYVLIKTMSYVHKGFYVMQIRVIYNVSIANGYFYEKFIVFVLFPLRPIDRTSFYKGFLYHAHLFLNNIEFEIHLLRIANIMITELFWYLCTMLHET